ncbi:MAG TPA: hypothetical protein VKY74_26345 [Chloroflexia bacterium]|nr:hypothetical protein [Chloroflexia bacterium]
MLYTEPPVIMARMAADSQGRQRESVFEAAVHRDLQAGVALIYGVTLGMPIYFLDSNRPPHEVVAEIARRLQAQNPLTTYEPQQL